MKGNQANVFYRLPVLDGLEALKATGHHTPFPFHTHPTYNISIVTAQPFHTQLIDKSCPAPVGAIVITHPNEVHATFCDAKMGSSFFTFYFSPELLLHLNQQQPVFFQQQVIMDAPLYTQLLQVAEHIHEPCFPVALILQNVLKKLVRQYGSNNQMASSPNSIITAVLEDELFEKFSLEKTAQKLGMDKFGFIRQFKKETGLTPNHYLILRRIEQCKILLQSQSDLLDIAIQTGFYDATHLCKYFKKITGVTPLAYQQAS